jgi:hypothetical protein
VLSLLEEAPARSVSIQAFWPDIIIASIVRDRAGPPFGGCRRLLRFAASDD